jgi:serine/threonine protein kinase
MEAGVREEAVRTIPKALGSGPGLETIFWARRSARASSARSRWVGRRTAVSKWLSSSYGERLSEATRTAYRKSTAIHILRGLEHPNIVRLHEMVETERHIGIILEYASGGELFDYILNHRYLKDGAARRLFAQLISGVGYLHKKGIVHRDLKLENLLLDRNRNIIITDFGFANTFDADDELGEDIEFNLSNKEFVKAMGLEGGEGARRGDLMQTSCGSPCYAAPELVVSDSLYTGRKVDVWSCGVILVRYE